jgi:alpha-tubulin suppressor-like RCC1 family protein
VGTNGTLYGLGDNRWKKLSQSLGDVVSTPVALVSNAAFVDSGEHQILAVDTYGNLYYAGWREFNSFQQGNGNNPTVRRVMGDVKKADVYCADMVVLDVNGTAYVYGLNYDNALGKTPVTGGMPKKILDGVLDVAAGYGFTAYLMEDGTIRVQGDNTFGQAGNGTTSAVANMAEVIF